MNRRSFFGSLMAGVVALLLPFKSNENTQFVVNNSYDIDENGFGVWKCNGNFTLAKPFGRWRRNATEADFKELCSHVPQPPKGWLLVSSNCNWYIDKPEFAYEVIFRQV